MQQAIRIDSKHYKKKEKVIKKRKTLNKKKKKLHDTIVFMQFFLHICEEMRGGTTYKFF